MTGLRPAAAPSRSAGSLLGRAPQGPPYGEVWPGPISISVGAARRALPFRSGGSEPGNGALADPEPPGRLPLAQPAGSQVGGHPRPPLGEAGPVRHSGPADRLALAGGMPVVVIRGTGVPPASLDQGSRSRPVAPGIPGLFR